MAVTPMYSSPANESGEPQGPLFWVEGYIEDDQLAIASYGGEPYRRANEQTPPVDPGSPGWDPSEGTGELPPVAAIAWSQLDPALHWNHVDPMLLWEDVTMTLPT